ncbi:SurA N-terminal domain-containing protein [Paenibacillus daejeonensis]|uniref:SurA N-terminal domain-containing protein n=1 Tax=Paenibacillus daejeonensis TaxID=135193 RepID=UPI000371D905|nr:SurA N-terminal domain-containing protein [Paenibacillus daejeonensis]
MKQRIWLLSILVVCVVAGAFVATHFMGNQMSPTAVAQVKGVAVEQEEFRESKENRRMLVSVGVASPEDPFIQLSDEKIIENLITPKLVAEKAIRKGITIPEEDVDEQIAHQRKMLEEIDPSDEQQAMAIEVMAQTLERKGMTEEEYWQAETTREGYRSWLYLSALMDEMREIEDPEEWRDSVEYRQELYNQIQDDIVYNYDLIQEINNSLEG